MFERLKPGSQLSDERYLQLAWDQDSEAKSKGSGS